MSGIETTKLIRVNIPRTAVIGLTAGEPDHQDMAMIAAGASAVINNCKSLSCHFRSRENSKSGNIQVKFGEIRKVQGERLGHTVSAAFLN
jgi:DNA-binding NarL/FixJ family response regulator